MDPLFSLILSAAGLEPSAGNQYLRGQTFGKFMFSSMVIITFNLFL